jgi:hypothetical protein
LAKTQAVSEKCAKKKKTKKPGSRLTSESHWLSPHLQLSPVSLAMGKKEKMNKVMVGDKDLPSENLTVVSKTKLS